MYGRMNLRKGIASAALAGAIAVSAAAAAGGPVARFHTPSGPGFLAIDHGGVWVAAHRGGALYELDPRTNRIARTIRTNDDVFDITVMGRYLVLSEGAFPGLRLIDPATGKTVRYTHDGVMPARWGGSAWKLTQNGIARLDPKTHLVLKRFRVRSSEGPPVKDAGSLWIPSDAWVTRIVLATNAETVIPLPGSETQAGPNQGYAIASHLVATPGKIWTGNPAGIYWIDEATNKATSVPGTRVGNLDQWGNIGMTVGQGSVFARTGPTTVSRIDPNTATVVGTYPAAGGGGDVAVGFGSLWVTNFGTDSTWRESLTGGAN